MPDTVSFRTTLQDDSTPLTEDDAPRQGSTSLREAWHALWRRRRFVAAVEAALLAACILYCLVAPSKYEASASVELRTEPASSLSLDTQEPFASASLFTAPLALETLAGVLRSDRLGWRVITELKLYQQPGFSGRFASRFPGFDPSQPSPAAEEWLLKRFEGSLHVQTVPRTFLVDVRFRSRDAALSAAVVNGLIHAYQEQETDAQIQATAHGSAWLNAQLADLKARVDRDDRRLVDYEAQHGIMSTPGVQADGQQGETEHASAFLEIDELSRQMVAASTDRILSEAEFRAASEGDPELVIAADPRLQASGANLGTALLDQIHARRSDLQQEQAQLSAEHGPSFPRVVEIGRQLEDLDRQKQAEDAKLVEHFRSNWQTAVDREQLLRKSLEQATSEGMKLNAAVTEYAMMRNDDNASHNLYLRVLEKSEEAGLAAGVRSSSISVVDPARQPGKPVAPNMPLYLAITFFVGLWIAVAAALLRESLWRESKLRESRARFAGGVSVLLALLAAGVCLHAQPPMPSTSGLPGGVVKVPQSPSNRTAPNPSNQAPTPWDNAGTTGQQPLAAAPNSPPMPGPITPGDLLDISESHTPEFHSSVRVSADGTVTLPMIGVINLAGMDEPAAAHAIEAALAAKGMLLHPLVSVLVTAYVGQDVSVLGEVARPGVYPYTYHHRLLDLISAAQGLSPNAGRLVNVFHASDPKMPHAVILDPSGTDTSSDHNPELIPGDTVQVSRAGLVYVVGDVIRPGGFPVDPVQGLTVVQALSLAWGPSENAAIGRAILIREQKGGRTMVTLNLKRMLHGQDPDQPVLDRDILYVPDSFAKNFANRTLDSIVQSAIGVTIYSALVYSQRY